MRDRRPHPIDIPGFRTLGTVFKVVLLLALAAFVVFALFSVCTIFAAVNMERRDWKLEEMNAARGQLPPHRERIASISPQWTLDGALIALGHMGDIYTVAPDDRRRCVLFTAAAENLTLPILPKYLPTAPGWRT